MERVIFRMERDLYNARDNILACWPDDPHNPGRIACTPFFFHNGKAIFEPYCEADDGYYYKTKIIRKNTPMAARALAAIEEYYGGPFKVCEHR